ncbi:MAG: hypothetical protein RSF90_03595 [Pygmaiobacter sp.]
MKKCPICHIRMKHGFCPNCGLSEMMAEDAIPYCSHLAGEDPCGSPHESLRDTAAARQKNADAVWRSDAAFRKKVSEDTEHTGDSRHRVTGGAKESGAYMPRRMSPPPEAASFDNTPPTKRPASRASLLIMAMVAIVMMLQLAVPIITSFSSSFSSHEMVAVAPEPDYPLRAAVSVDLPRGADLPDLGATPLTVHPLRTPIVVLDTEDFTVTLTGISAEPTVQLELTCTSRSTAQAVLAVQNPVLVNDMVIPASLSAVLPPRSEQTAWIDLDAAALQRAGITALDGIQFSICIFQNGKEDLLSTTVTTMNTGDSFTPAFFEGTPIFENGSFYISYLGCSGCEGSDQPRNLTPEFWFGFENTGTDPIVVVCTQATAGATPLSTGLSVSLNPGERTVASTGHDAVFISENAAPLPDCALTFDVMDAESGLALDTLELALRAD